MLKCKSAKKYKGILIPTCNSGKPCEVCKEIYRKRHPVLDKEKA